MHLIINIGLNVYLKAILYLHYCYFKANFMLQYRLKISEPSNTFATRCKLRVNALVEKSNAFAN